MTSADKRAVAAYIEPYSQPEPSVETGLGTKLPAVNPPAYTNSITPQSTAATTASMKPDTTGASVSTNPFRKSSPPQASRTPPVVSSHARKPSAGGSPHRGSHVVSSHVRNYSTGGSPHRGLTPTGTEKFPTLPSHHRRDGSLSNIDDGPVPVVRGGPDSGSRRSSAAAEHGSPKTRPRRVSSLNERFPGDPSVRPLDTLRDEARAAHRSPHLRKQHLPGQDTIDMLDSAALHGYHHEGPYDAALLARNTEPRNSPVAALRETTRETLKATPRENVIDSLERHRPLDGVAITPSGTRDEQGRLFIYQEGSDMMREDGGDYRRWPGVQYHPDDLKGKGEPSFSIERALKHKGKDVPTDGNYIELVDRPRQPEDSVTKSTPDVNATEVGTTTATTSSAQPHESYAEWEASRRLGRSGSQRLSGEFKRRLGSLRGRKESAAGAAA